MSDTCNNAEIRCVSWGRVGVNGQAWTLSTIRDGEVDAECRGFAPFWSGPDAFIELDFQPK